MDRPDSPPSWTEFRSNTPRLLRPVLAVEWILEWVVYHFKRWAFIEFLELVGRFAVLVAVVNFLLGADDRAKSSYYQAWQLINSSNGIAGDGGRGQALTDLYKNGYSLEGVDLRNAVLRELILPGAALARARFDSSSIERSDLAGAFLYGASLRDVHWSYTDLNFAILMYTNLSGAWLSNVSLCWADLTDADLRNADLTTTELTGASFVGADLRGAKLYPNRSIGNLKHANVAGTNQLFLSWAIKQGAVSIADDATWLTYRRNTEAERLVAKSLDPRFGQDIPSQVASCRMDLAGHIPGRRSRSR